MMLPTSFLDRPITHRALHDRTAGRAENSIKSIEAAIASGYGIEIDVQLTSDGHAMVFHDNDLDRLTDETGRIRARTCSELIQIPLKDDGGTIPTLNDVLALISGRAPLVVEIKDQDGEMGPNIGRLECAVANALEGYSGDIAVMSYNPHAVAKMAELVPHIPRGIVTSAFVPTAWPEIPIDTGNTLRDIPDYDRVGACFISHQANDLHRPRVAELKAQGATILCWTIKSANQEAQARRVADNVTFEGYLA